jgi:tRNA pseudouridine55 synthase
LVPDPPLEGAIVLVDKPAGITSHDAVARAKRRFGAKAGHAGTLDPFATGLLIVLLGRGATREQRRFMGLPKTYRVRARFGAVSTTGDRDGEITETGIVPDGPLDLPTGEIRQRPPTYSAVKVGGERAYKRARRGERFELPERLVTVNRFEQVSADAPEREFEVECSSGTYVRSLVADLGDAYCTELRRTAIGPFTVEEADEATPIPLAEALARLPSD